MQWESQMETENFWYSYFKKCQFSSVAQSCPLTLCDPTDCSSPGFSCHHQLLGLTQTHVHRVSGAFQPPHPLLSPSLPAFNLSQHQGLFQWLSTSQQVAKVMELHHQFFPSGGQSTGVSVSASVLPVNVQDWFPLVDWLDLLAVQGTLKSLLQQSQFKSITSSALSFLYGLTFTLIHNYWKNYKLWS